MVINEEREKVSTNIELPFVLLEFSGNNLLGRSYILNDGYVINKYYTFKYDGKKLIINETYPEIVKLEKINLNNTDKNVEINNKHVNLKVVDNELYFNGKKIEGSFVENVYLTNYLLLTTNIGQCDEVINMAIDENGNLVKINGQDYQVHDIRIKNNQLIASGDKCPCEEDSCNNNSLRTISYNGNNVVIE